MREFIENILVAIGVLVCTLGPAAIFFALGWYFAVQLAASTPLPV